jgi:hypothetical protein
MPNQGYLMIRIYFSIVSCLGLALTLSTTVRADNPSDYLSSEHATFNSGEETQILGTVVSNVKEVFEAYVPAVDSSTQIVSPKTVTGPPGMPHLHVGIHACVFIICRTVDVEAQITIQPVSGACAQNFMLNADLSQSSALVANSYDRLDVSICINPLSSGPDPDSFDLTVSASALRASGYHSGPLASYALKFMKLQAQPMLEALNQTLIQNGVQNLSVQP